MYSYPNRKIIFNNNKKNSSCFGLKFELIKMKQNGKFCSSFILATSPVLSSHGHRQRVNSRAAVLKVGSMVPWGPLEHFQGVSRVKTIFVIMLKIVICHFPLFFSLKYRHRRVPEATWHEIWQQIEHRHIYESRGSSTEPDTEEMCQHVKQCPSSP